MPTFYTSSSNQRDTAPILYVREHLPSSFAEAPVQAPVLHGNMMMYMNSGPYSDSLAENSQQQNNCMDPSLGASNSSPQQREILSNLGGSRLVEHDFNAWGEGRNGILVTHPMGSAASILHSGQNLQGQGLSLSLSTQIPSEFHMPSIPYQNPNSGFASLLSPNSSVAGDCADRNDSSRDEPLRSADYLPASFTGGQDLNKGDLSPFGMSSIVRTIPNSKYLKAAQQLLDEVVNVRKALKQPDVAKNVGIQEHPITSPMESDGGTKNETAMPPTGGGPPYPQESACNSPHDLSHAEKQDLQNKLTKLLSMSDEVDRRYKQYYHQMQIVVSSFDVIVGCGAAKPYTALALQTISRHFRCLRDAITGQIQVARKSLGEQDSSGNSKGVGITRLRYVDQQLRQQRTLQQLGMMQQHAWRPQRGLPESSVSILRAWLFEHFLHPYPKDSDKIMLARQTGLTRSQVSNWFINARVRLWKPMVEEMYKEEIGDAEMDTNSSSDNVGKATKGNDGTFEDRGEDFQQSMSSTATERCSTSQLMDSKPDGVPDVQMAGSPRLVNYQDRICGEAENEYGLVKRREEQRPSMDGCNLFPDAASERFMAAAAAAYHMSELERFGVGSGVSLTLGLQHCEGGSLPISGVAHHSFITMGGDQIYNAPPSSVGTETADFECMNPGNQQHRFSSSHLLHDFVV
ncbi:BEL1-like homeodomain protein 6 [Juglans microcarpa x Juglans regia]|uniref:BEL1-like homeodomain protein 6 n=1 Tax=Juglans microcarpa x Juglans regia TaxID=2249226 RepID=UPI001B7DF0BE|nr:BEL1-like homeodomain protein 6 [Juglans microcarpa x Juglans regia]